MAHYRSIKRRRQFTAPKVRKQRIIQPSKKDYWVVESNPFVFPVQRILLELTEKEVERFRQERPEMNLRRPDPEEVEELAKQQADQDLTSQVNEVLQKQLRMQADITAEA
jgi:hypothetical protein